jgi:hypothetical protein
MKFLKMNNYCNCIIELLNNKEIIIKINKYRKKNNQKINLMI